jgi:hypothetical protein
MPVARRWRVVILINLAAMALLAAGVLLGTLLPPGPAAHGVGIAAKLLSWDGFWYQDIAAHGYQWDPAAGTTLGQHQNIAFFPLYALADWAAMRLTGSAAPVWDILPGLAFGLWSNAAFYRLAETFTPRPGTATALFACWPAICFHAMGYPAGLLNLCVIMTLMHVIEDHHWRAALWCGIGTAVAPTGVFVAAAIILDAAWRACRSARPAANILNLAAFATLSLSGLLVFITYQAIRFGDPFAFIAAQRGFTRALPFFRHVLLVFDPYWYAIVPQFAWTAIENALHHGLLTTPAGREVLCAAFQLALDLSVLIAWVVLLCIARRRERHGVIVLAGWFVTLGYVWFMATTDKGLVNGIRMLYPAIAGFLVLGRLQPVPARSLLALFALLAILETALVVAGYTVI